MKFFDRFDNFFSGNIIFVFIFVAFIILFITILIKNISKNKKVINEKKELVSNNEFILKNKDKYEHLLDENAKSLESERKNAILFTAVLFCGIALSIFFLNDHLLIMIMVIMVLIILCIWKVAKYYALCNEQYNETVKTILKEYNNNFEYYPDKGYEYEEYQSCLFYEDCDLFHSEDMIVDKTKGFCYADVVVESEHEDKDGDTHYVVEFEGSLARIDIKDVDCNILLGSNSIFKRGDYKTIKFENDEFNKLFKASSDNEFLAYKILTPDVMEEFVNIKKNTIGDIDIRIMDDKLYIRFSSGNSFEPGMFNKKNEKEQLFSSIAVLEEIMKTMEKVKKIIEKKNMN